MFCGKDEQLSQIFHFVMRLKRTSREGFAAAMANAPKCHFTMLDRLRHALEQNGQDGQISVSALAKALHENMPSVSRMLRILEEDGLVQRYADPNDRRKTYVRITAKGAAACESCHDALRLYMRGVLDRLGNEEFAQMVRSWQQLETAMTEETAALLAKRQTGTENTKGDTHTPC